MSTLLLAGVIFLAFMVQTASGFGGAVVALTLGALFLPLRFLLAVVAPVSVLLSVWVVIRERRKIAFRLLATQILPFSLVGLGVGVLLHDLAEGIWLRRVFALFICTIASAELWRAWSRKGAADRAPSRLEGALWLMTGGVAHGVFATGGPILVYFASRMLPEKGAFRGTLAVMWIVLNLLLIANFWREGYFSRDTLVGSASMLMPLALGTVAGEWIHARMDALRFRMLVFVVLLFAGLVLTASAWRGA